MTGGQSTAGSGRHLTGAEVAGLVRAAAQGEEAAWDALARQFDGLLWAIAHTHRLCAADAADVVQATWVRLLEHLDSLQEPARVGAWLATTARRECLRVLRHSQRHVLCGEDDTEYPSPDVPPDEAMVAAERAEALRRGFARLRDGDQTLLRLLLAEPRLPYEEISAALKIPIGSIGPTRARALERLRRELAKEDTLTLMTA